MIFFFSASNSFTYSAGSPSGYTGSPGDNLSTCVSCHGVNSPSNLMPCSLSLISDIDEYYQPGHLYNFTINVSGYGINKFGFQTCFEDAEGQKK